MYGECGLVKSETSNRRMSSLPSSWRRSGVRRAESSGERRRQNEAHGRFARADAREYAIVRRTALMKPGTATLVDQQGHGRGEAETTVLLASGGPGDGQPVG